MTAELQADKVGSHAMANRADRHAVKTVICEEAARLCTERYRDRLRALVLTGSLARDEATAMQERDSWRLLGDAEFLLVLDKRAPLLSAREVDALRRDIEGNLASRRIQCRISLSSSHTNYLQRLRPDIFAYELKTCGQVVLGEAGILSLITDFSPSDIPLEDAWRLLCNRMVEHLEAVAGLPGKPVALPQGLFYQTIKLYLDMATSLLLFAAEYRPTYRHRAERLRALANGGPPTQHWPFPVEEFAQQVNLCTQWKLSGIRADEFGNGSRWALWEEAIQYAGLLWRWELAQLAGAESDVPDQELLEKWMRRQPLHRRLRGWLYVLRQLGWHRSWHQWPRWGRRGWRASPRYWIYGAASELFFRLPSLLPAGEAAQADDEWEELSGRLPVTRQLARGSGSLSWRQLAADIFWNYSEFVMDTRS